MNFSADKVKIFIKRSIKFVTPHGVLVLYKRRLEVLSKTRAIAGRLQIDDNKVAVIIPFQNIKYGDLLRESIHRAGYKATDKPEDAKYIWLHWYESGIEEYSDFINKLSAINTWREQGRKVIVHVHNKKPHESPVPNISHALVTTLVDTADQVVIMCEETKGVLRYSWYYGDDFSKVSLVPHPNYIDAYGKKLKAPDSLKDNTLKVLFFGLVRPYKGIEHLINATDGLKNIEISIYGKPKDDNYVEEIKKLCGKRDNVNFRLEFIPDEDIPALFAEHHIVALPYSIESSLNSGAAILALSYARTVVGTNNGTLKDLEDQSLYFGYDYVDSDDHVRQLRKSIRDIQKQYNGKYNDLLIIGDRAYKSMKKNNGIEAVSQSVKGMIQHIEQQ